ncbi:MAG: hypothetical protein AAF578_09815 [Pseudomonadota bacterium]
MLAQYLHRLSGVSRRFGRLMPVILAAGLVSCSNEPTLKTFTSDGCSLFPDRAELLDAEWCECCLEHDVAYWKGGTEAARAAADESLRICVAQKTGNETLADLMYEGVRAGGHPAFPTWYRWGYGWSTNRGYAALSAEQEKQAEEILSVYKSSAATAACGL